MKSCLASYVALYFHDFAIRLGEDGITAQASSTSVNQSTRSAWNQGSRVCRFRICSPAEQAEIVRILNDRLAATDALEAEIDASLSRAEALRQSILKKAFAGKLVPQNPNDEPTQALLSRIRTNREEDSTTKPRKPARRRVSARNQP